MSNLLFSFALLADIQYADKEVFEFEPGKFNFYRTSLERYEKAISLLNSEKLAFCFQLGDLIDGYKADQILPPSEHQSDFLPSWEVSKNLSKWQSRSFEDLLKLQNLFQKHNTEVKHVIGNHCLSVPRPLLLQTLNLSSPYYSFLVNRFRFIILDGTEISLYGAEPDSPNFLQAQEYLSTHKVSDFPEAQTYNGAIGATQLAWLRSNLEIARQNSEIVFVFCHQPINPKASFPEHLLWNHQEVGTLLESFNDVVKLYVAGHYHPGGSEFFNGIQHLTVPGILMMPNEPVGAIVDVFANHLQFRPFGPMPSPTVTWI